MVPKIAYYTIIIPYNNHTITILYCTTSYHTAYHSIPHHTIPHYTIHNDYDHYHDHSTKHHTIPCLSHLATDIHSKINRSVKKKYKVTTEFITASSRPKHSSNMSKNNHLCLQSINMMTFLCRWSCNPRR